uniref:GDSL esterase/lipase At5g18430-like n=1 Tax=Erigeron canadensis TaxID=72917 RepID=UPI001CB934AC|nr:GDSL esterase/lipase At5g18430-like [Erigeron canadensis]
MSHLILVACFLLFILSHDHLVFGVDTIPANSPVSKNEPRAFFVFGDSLVDNGNNNFLMTTARADLPPYGIDYPTHRPSGRFCNGKNIPDLIAEEIGVEPLLPYLDRQLDGKKLLNGANFASAGIGILNDTGFQFVNVIRMPYQLAFFEQYQKRVANLIGPEKTKKLVNEALVLITCGGNDFVNNYYLVRRSLRSFQYQLPDYVKLLVTEYEKILKRLYDLGARKVLVTATGPLGCAPSVMALRSQKGECAVELQEAASLFNPQVVSMIGLLNKKLGSDVFISVEAHHLYHDFIKNPKAFGFEVGGKACCGQGLYNGLGLCTMLSNLCPNRDNYVYWDGYHPTERANRLIVQEIFNGTKYMKPMNLSTIMAIDFMKA